MEIWFLAAALFLALLLVPLGLPGLWTMLGAAGMYNLLVPTGRIGWVPFGIAFALTAIAELLEFTVSAKYTKKYGGSARAGWGAILGGLGGAIVGTPVPIIGSVIGAFVGAFVGALAMEYTRREATSASATRVATGALIGRVAATAVKTGLGCAVAATLLIAAAR